MCAIAVSNCGRAEDTAIRKVKVSADEKMSDATDATAADLTKKSGSSTTDKKYIAIEGSGSSTSKKMI